MSDKEKKSESMRHEIVSRNPDIEVRFYLSVDEGSYVTPHWHDSIEIVYMIEGGMTVICENQRRELREGELVIMNSRVLHSVLSTRNKAFVLQIPKEVMKKYIPDIDLYVFDVENHPESKVEQTRLERVKHIFTDMQVIYDVRPEGYQFRFNSLLYELLFLMIHSYSHKIVRKNFAKDDKYLNRLNDIMLYLKEQYREKITLPDLAHQFGYHEDYLARFFKKQTGMTIHEYLYTYRVTKACQELMSTDKSIHTIFEENGCANMRVAMRVFKEIYGCTPKQKRKQKKETNPK